MPRRGEKGKKKNRATRTTNLCFNFSMAMNILVICLRLRILLKMCVNLDVQQTAQVIQFKYLLDFSLLS